MLFKNIFFIIELNLGKNLLIDLVECYFFRIKLKLELLVFEIVNEYFCL